LSVPLYKTQVIIACLKNFSTLLQKNKTPAFLNFSVSVKTPKFLNISLSGITLLILAFCKKVSNFSLSKPFLKLNSLFIASSNNIFPSLLKKSLISSVDNF